MTAPITTTSTFERHRSASVERRQSAEAGTSRKTEELIEKLKETITQLQTENASLQSRMQTAESDYKKQKAGDSFLISTLQNQLGPLQAYKSEANKIVDRIATNIQSEVNWFPQRRIDIERQKSERIRFYSWKDSFTAEDEAKHIKASIDRLIADFKKLT